MAIEFQLQSFATTSNAVLVGKIATVASIGIFAGSALSYNTIIMPSIRKFATNSSLAIWHETLNTSKYLSNTSLALSIIGNAGLYYKTKNVSYLYSAVTIAAVIPYTFIALVPIHKTLSEIRQNNTVNGKSDSLKDNKSNDSAVEALLKRWNLLHSVRTTLSYSALLISLYAVISDRGVRFVVFK